MDHLTSLLIYSLRYVPPLKPATSRWALDLPECPSAIEEELKKQESLLNHMHEELMRVNDHRKEEELWEVQRIVTQLKRKVQINFISFYLEMMMDFVGSFLSFSLSLLSSS